MTSQVTKDVNNVYYDIVMTNNSNQYKNAEFVEERNQDIVAKASDYQMSIVRFSIPGYTIPIAIMETLGTNASTLAYSVSLSHVVAGVEANVQQTYLQWVPENNLPTPQNFVDSASIYSYEYYSLYNYQAFVDLVNTAFSTCYTALASKPAGCTAPPYIVFDPVTKLMTLIAQQAYITNGADKIEIYMNQKLFFFFNSFNNTYKMNAVNGKDYLIDFKYVYENQPTQLRNAYTTPNVAGTNPTANSPVYAITQDYPVLFNWNSMRSIVFTTGIIPIRQEYTPSIDPVSGLQNTTGTMTFKPIVTDFVPNVSDGTENRSIIVYNPTAEYRMIDLTSDAPLRKIQISLYWQDERLRLYPVKIGPYDLITIKMLLRRKRV